MAGTSRPVPPASPLDLLWRAQAVLTVMLCGEGLALVLAAAPGAGDDFWLSFALASLFIQWTLLLALGALYLFRSILARWQPLTVAWTALACLVLCALSVGTGALWFLRIFALPSVDGPKFLLQAATIALTVGAFAVATAQAFWRARQLALQTKQAQLEALRARTRPHFLFNTLNTGAALVHARPEQAERLLLDLADLFRAALSGPGELALEEEIGLVRRYLEIEALRFGDRLDVQWRLPDPLPDVRIPTLSIQPLVENAIRHGIEPSPRGGRLEIAVSTSADGVRVVVRNDLPPAGRPAATGHQVGLASARERVEALSGGGGRGRLETRVEDGRYVATIHLPTT